MREGALFLLFLAVTTKATRSRNVTIDDQFGDEITHVAPTYSPSSGWKLAGTGGYAKPNASLAYKETWHDLTQNPGHAAAIVNFGFTGTSLYVYCIIGNTPPGPHTDTFADYKFFLEEDLVGVYMHDVEKIPDYFFNVPVYVNTTLENKHHNFSIIVESTEKPVLILFDYATYTTMEADAAVEGISTTTSVLIGPPTQSQPLSNPNVKGEYGNTHSELIVSVTLGALLFVAVSVIIYHRIRKARPRAVMSTIKPWRSSIISLHPDTWHAVSTPPIRRPKVARIATERLGVTGGLTGVIIGDVPPPYIP